MFSEEKLSGAFLWKTIIYTVFQLVFKSLGSVRILFCKEINTFIEQGSLKLIESGSKIIYIVTKYLYFKCCSFGNLFEFRIHFNYILKCQNQ